MTNQYKGSCLCGLCSYTIIAVKPEAMYLCHCSRCRKETGSIHAANAFFKSGQLIWESGIEDNVGYFQLKGTRKQRAFCKNCGSPLPREDDSCQIILPAGTLDNNILITPTAHIHYASRISWEDETVNLKRFDNLPE